MNNEKKSENNKINIEQESEEDFKEKPGNKIKETKTTKEKKIFNQYTIILISIIALILIFNQVQISAISSNFASEIKKIDPSKVYDIKTTSQAIASLFPVEEIQTEQDVINMMISQGTPDYGNTRGITFDDPVGSMNLLASNYNNIKTNIKQNNPEIWERYLNLATKPVGISCEFCCGVGPVGITKKGDLRCGCKHNPAIQTLTMLLMKDTNYNDAEVLREVLKWKSLWFPRDMVGLAMKASGGQIETQLPGMVGGC